MSTHLAFRPLRRSLIVARVAAGTALLAQLLCVACGTVGPTQRSKDVAQSNKPFRGIECEPELVLECEPACGRGDMNACEIAGIGYLQGVAVHQDLGRARIMLERSCEAGLAVACSNYAKMAQDNQGVTMTAERVLSLLRMGCDQGDTNACARVGKLLLDGNPNPTQAQLQEAARRYEVACDAGEADACFALGVAAKTGSFGKRDLVKASRLLTDACHHDDAAACHELAELQSAPNTALTDPVKALKSYNKACSLRVAEACAKLGDVHARGIGVTKNASKAGTLYHAACELDHAQSCLALGQHQLERDPEAASSTLQKACDANIPQACFERALLLEGRTPGVTAEPERALALYQRACDAKVARACTYASLLTIQLNPKLSGTERDQVVKRIEQGCSVEHETDACRHWGTWLAAGEHGIKRDGAKAAEIFGPLCTRAETQEDATVACYQLGQLNEHGVGMDRNLLGASSFYQKACAAEHAPACHAHANLLWTGGPGLTKDAVAAVRVFKQQCNAAAKDAQSEACVSLANAEMVGEGTARNEEHAVSLLKAQCDRGLQSGCAYLGQYHLSQRGNEAQLKRGETLLRSACDSGNGRACFFLTASPRLPASQRKELTKRACQLGTTEACATADSSTK